MPKHVFVATLLNPKAIVFALGIVPFGVAHVWAYMLALLPLIIFTALVWITAGAQLGKVADWRGWRWAIPRLSAAGIGTFAVIFLFAALKS